MCLKLTYHIRERNLDQALNRCGKKTLQHFVCEPLALGLDPDHPKYRGLFEMVSEDLPYTLPSV